MKVAFIGDIHGEVGTYLTILRRYEYDLSIQVGDLGVGFVPVPVFDKDKNKFISGNHDNPHECRKRADYLGRYGTTKEGIFFVSGAYSIDQALRRENRDWWRAEELTEMEMNEAIIQYTQARPQVVVTHDGPRSAVKEMKGPVIDASVPQSWRGNITQTGLDQMFQIHQPRLWVFGHHHDQKEFELRGTKFVVLGINRVFLADIQNQKGEGEDESSKHQAQ